MRRRVVRVLGTGVLPVLGACAGQGAAPVASVPEPQVKAYTWAPHTEPAMDAGTVTLLRTEAAAYLEREGWRYAPEDSAATRVAVFIEGLDEEIAATRRAKEHASASSSGSQPVAASPLPPNFAGATRSSGRLNGFSGADAPVLTFAWTAMPRDDGPPGPPPYWARLVPDNVSLPFAPMTWPVMVGRPNAPVAVREPAVVEAGRVVLVLHTPDGSRRVLRSSNQVQTLAFWGARPTAADTSWTRVQLARAVEEIMRAPSR